MSWVPSLIFMVVVGVPILLVAGGLALLAVITVLECLAAPVVELAKWANSKISD